MLTYIFFWLISALLGDSNENARQKIKDVRDFAGRFEEKGPNLEDKY